MATSVSHVKANDTPVSEDGSRKFFACRGLDIAKATDGKVIAQLVRANDPPEVVTRRHFHGAPYHIVYLLQGWAKFMYEDQETQVTAGDFTNVRVAGLATSLRRPSGPTTVGAHAPDRRSNEWRL
jgi:AraC-like ligand binding domain